MSDKFMFKIVLYETLVTVGSHLEINLDAEWCGVPRICRKGTRNEISSGWCKNRCTVFQKVVAKRFSLGVRPESLFWGGRTEGRKSLDYARLGTISWKSTSLQKHGNGDQILRIIINIKYRYVISHYKTIKYL